MIKKIPLFLAIIVLMPLFGHADIVYLKNGEKLQAERTWEENGQIKCLMFGSVLGYSKEDVERIEVE